MRNTARSGSSHPWPARLAVHDRVRDAHATQHARLWRALAAWSGSCDVADEAVAETFAQLLRRGEAVEDPVAWVWRAAFRIAAAELQRRRADVRYEVDEVPLPAGTADVVLDLMRALQHLTEQQRVSSDEVERLLRLGDPMGDHIVLAPA